MVDVQLFILVRRISRHFYFQEYPDYQEYQDSVHAWHDTILKYTVQVHEIRQNNPHFPEQTFCSLDPPLWVVILEHYALHIPFHPCLSYILQYIGPTMVLARLGTLISFYLDGSLFVYLCCLSAQLENIWVIPF